MPVLLLLARLFLSSYACSCILKDCGLSRCKLLIGQDEPPVQACCFDRIKFKHGLLNKPFSIETAGQGECVNFMEQVVK